MRPKIDIPAIEQSTRVALERGYRVFQPHHFAPTDKEHVAFLLSALDPPAGGVVLDAGCGIGEVSRLMHALRPDLYFVMANVSRMQLAHCPQGDHFASVEWDLHDIPQRSPMFDAVMFSAALVQMDAPVALAETRRVTRPGGVLLLNEMVMARPKAVLLEESIGARVLPFKTLLAHVKDTGWTLDWADIPAADDALFRQLMAEDGLTDLVDTVHPCLMRAINKEQLQ